MTSSAAPKAASTASQDTQMKTSNDDSRPESTGSSDLDGRPPPRNQVKYRNSLLAIVGWLDFTNSLDFPANIFNDTPIPVHAMVLMALGGSVAIIATAWAIWDICRCWKNISFLRAERRALQQERKQHPNAGNTVLRKAWLGANFRELGWELIDRFLLDVIMVISGFMVGAGTLMAMRGDDPTIFHASNLMSGYVGNSWLPFYASINLVWSSYMYVRATKGGESIRKSKVVLDERIAKALAINHRRHKIFSSGSAVTICIASVGAMMSATMWYGYVVLAPCCISSIVFNWYWRKRLGYDRSSFHDWVGATEDEYDILARIKANIIAEAYLEDGPRLLHDIDSADFPTGDKQGLSTILLTFVTQLDLGDDLRQRLSQVKSVQQAQDGPPNQHTSLEGPEMLDADLSILTAGQIVKDAGIEHFRSRQRFLLELYGYYLCYSDAYKVPSLDEKV